MQEDDDDIIEDVKIELNIEVKDGNTLILKYHEYGLGLLGLNKSNDSNDVTVEINREELLNNQTYTVNFKHIYSGGKRYGKEKFQVKDEPLLFNLLYYLAMDNDSILKGSLSNKKHKEAFLLFCKKYLDMYKNINIGEEEKYQFGLIKYFPKKELFISDEQLSVSDEQVANFHKQLILEKLEGLMKHVSLIQTNKRLQQEQKGNLLTKYYNSCYDCITNLCYNIRYHTLFNNGKSWLTCNGRHNDIPFNNDYSQENLENSYNENQEIL